MTEPAAIPDLVGEIGPEQKYGGAVKNGKLQYLSVSQIMKFNPEEDGCNLRFYYRYVLRRPEPERAFNDKGSRLHSQNDFYLKTGSDVRGKLALEGLHLLPAPGPDLLSEHGLNDKPRPPPKDGKQVNYYPPHESLVFANDVPLIGFGDLIDPRQKFANDAGDLVAMPGTVGVIDYKTASKLENVKAPEALIRITQMLGYGKFVQKKFPWATHVLLRHINYLTKKPTGWGDKPLAFTRDLHVTIASIAEAWEKRTGNIVEQIKKVAAAKNEREVQGNTAACTAFAGCPHQRNCYVFQSLTVKQKLELQYGSDITTKQEKKMNDLMARVRAAKAGASTNGVPAANAVPPAAPATNAAPPPPAAAAPGVLTANKAVQGQPYHVPSQNNAVYVFLSAVDQNGTIAYSFLPAAGGQPLPLGPNEVIVPLTASAAVSAAPVPPGPPPPPPAPVAVAPAAPAPSAGTPPPPPPWQTSAPPPPPPTGLTPGGRPRVPVTDVSGAPPPPPAPTAAEKAAADGRSKAAREAKKQAEIEAAAKAAAAAVTTKAPTEAGISEAKVQRLSDAIDIAAIVFKEKFNTTATPEQLLPYWLALLND